MKDETMTVDKSIVDSEVGLKDCSMLVMENSKEDRSDSEVADRNTVDQFLDEEPPQLKHE